MIARESIFVAALIVASLFTGFISGYYLGYKDSVEDNIRIHKTIPKKEAKMYKVYM